MMIVFKLKPMHRIYACYVDSYVFRDSSHDHLWVLVSGARFCGARPILLSKVGVLSMQWMDIYHWSMWKQEARELPIYLPHAIHWVRITYVSEVWAQALVRASLRLLPLPWHLLLSVAGCSASGPRTDVAECFPRVVNVVACCPRAINVDAMCCLRAITVVASFPRTINVVVCCPRALIVVMCFAHAINVIMCFPRAINVVVLKVQGETFWSSALCIPRCLVASRGKLWIIVNKPWAWTMHVTLAVFMR